MIFFGKSQTFLRNSDYKTFNEITIVQKNKKIIVTKKNFVDFNSDNTDKVLYENNLYDFYLNADTLIFFDKVKEIDEVKIEYENIKDKKEKSYRSNERSGGAVIFPNNRIATLVNIKTNKTTYIKSLSIFPVQNAISIDTNDDSILNIQLLGNNNGLPDDSDEILSFEKKISDLKVRKKDKVNEWKIVLPKIIKYRKNGFFVVFFKKEKPEDRTFFKMNNQSEMFMYFPKDGWRSFNINGYYYQLKILQ